MPPATFSDVKLLIVDLDNTLCDTFHSLSKNQWEHAAKMLERHHAKPEHVRLLRKDFGRFSFRHVLTGIGMSKKEERIALAAYDAVDIKPLKLYDDASAVFDIPVRKVLVTRGEPKLQKEKIAHLRIRKHFDAVYYVPTFAKKLDTFKRILKLHKLKPSEVLVIGDRVEEEILDANTLGIPSCLVLRPSWPVHRGVAKPNITVRSLYALKKRFSIATPVRMRITK